MAAHFEKRGYTLDVVEFQQLAHFMFIVEQFEMSMEVTELGLKKFPNDDVLVLQLGTLLAAVGEKEHALKVASPQLAKAPTLKVEHRLLAAQLYSFLSMEKEAVPLYETVVREAPNLSLEAYGRLAVYYESIGNKEKEAYWNKQGEAKFLEKEKLRDRREKRMRAHLPSR